ncbi:hypothetical protein Taro_029590 [Colocasia esculenta]|uniref:Uncharacterized protein n=1 Tax=Colocasia esculenta TaxID=4460 RepID=A0A843VRL9_COLES|nr:hypothetical protein [Colocasia esculenta]
MALEARNGGLPAYAGTGLELAVRELKQVCRVPKEMQRLITTMDRMKAVMKDAEQKQIGSHEVRLWFQEAKQVLLDAEDMIDEFATDAAVQLKGAHTDSIPTIRSMVSGWLNQLLMTRAAKLRIRKISSRFDRLQPQTAMLGLQISIGEGRRVELSTRRETSSLLPGETSVIGRDREKKHVIDMLFSSTQVVESSSNIKGFSVLPIVGMGGIGKTTLAQLVFNDQDVKQHFAELMMWVCVSNDFDPKRLTREMLEAAFAFKGKHEQYQVTNWDSMQRRLLQEVEGKTFLLVLDDVWEAEQDRWEELFKPLHFGKQGSKVLVTARSRVFVDKILGRMDAPMELEGLSDADIWSLFKRYALRGVIDAHGTISAEYSDLEPIGRSIVQRLKGSPLAARTIGSLLNNELDVQHWKGVLESEFWSLEQGEGGILPALQLSYQYLCGDMKQCFAYCSLFPKDYRFSRDKLVQSWEAQSFFRRGTGARMVKMGSKYFDELLYWSFFDLVSNDYGDYGYVMHDLVHDLAEYVSRDDCYRLEDQKLMEMPDTVRHMSVGVTKSDQIDVKHLCSNEKLRTLLILTRNRSGIQFRMNCDLLEELFLKLKMLRVLGLCDCDIRELPGSIGDLKHLRYIDLEGNDHLHALPESLGNLYNLQVLNLHRCSSLFALPATMSQLVNLGHLRAAYNLVSGINGLEKLTGLEELEVRGTKVRELQGMSMLRDLTVNELKEVKSKEEVLEARLHSMEHLQVLQLDWCYKSDKHSPWQMTFLGRSRDWDGVKELIKPELEEEVLQALRPSDGIKELHIRGYGGVKSPDWMEVPMLASYSSLRSVRLGMCPNWRVLPSSLSQLRHLESLVITSMSEWEEWSCPAPWISGQYPSAQQDPASAMLFFPCLRELEIKCCPKLKELPLVTPALRRLHLERVGASCLRGLWGRGAVETTTSSSHDSPLVSASLTTLHIYSCHNLTSIRGLLQHHLPGLEEVLIKRCYKLVSLPKRGFRHLTSLKRLHLVECPKLIRPLLLGEDGDEEDLILSVTPKDLMTVGCGCNSEKEFNSFCTSSSQSPPTPLPSPLADASTIRAVGGLPSSLEQLTIAGDDNLDHESLSTGLQELTSLKCLTLEHFENLCSLPNLSGLASLKTMEIEQCPSIQLLPTRDLPPSLENLRIYKCPALTGEHRHLDKSLWPEVSHVPSVIIDGYLLK